MLNIFSEIFMDVRENIKSIIFKICIIVLFLCTLIWFSIFSYGILYYLYIPEVAHMKPVHLHYDMSCSREKQGLCKHPFDNITLIEEGEYEFLRGGQGYAIEIVLEMPESERNFDQGMFMVKLDMLDHTGAVIQSAHRSAMLHYRSPLFKMIYTLFFVPGLLSGSLEEKQFLTVSLFEKYFENSHQPSHFAYLEVQAQLAEVYSSSLQIHAQFTGLRYLMYYWPVSSAVIGIFSNFLFMLTTIIILLQRNMKSEDTEQQPLPQTNVKRISRKKQFQKPMGGPSRDRTPEKKTDMPIRIKKERFEIVDLPRHSGLHEKQCIEKSNIRKQEDECKDEQFFDAENIDFPSISQSMADNAHDFPPVTLKQRLKHVLGKKESSL